MNFYIINAENISYQLDESLRLRLDQNEFGRQHGLSVVSTLRDYKEGVLTIVTEMKYVALTPVAVLDVAQARFLSSFEFINPVILNAGVNANALGILTECVHLAQAHAYSVFSVISNEKGLPHSGMELTPLENFQPGLKAFLQEHHFPLN